MHERETRACRPHRVGMPRPLSCRSGWLVPGQQRGGVLQRLQPCLLMSAKESFSERTNAFRPTLNPK
jgi:hypothetical protein